MKIIITVCIIAFSLLFLVIRYSEKSKGRLYSFKDFLLELFNHGGDGSNYKR